jgi:hypothetical protein
MSKAYQCLESSALPPHLLSPSPSLPPALSLYTIRRKEAYSDRCQVQHLRRFTGGAHQSEDFEFWVLGFGFQVSLLFSLRRDTFREIPILRIERHQFCPILSTRVCIYAYSTYRETPILSTQRVCIYAYFPCLRLLHEAPKHASTHVQNQCPNTKHKMNKPRPGYHVLKPRAKYQIPRVRHQHLNTMRAISITHTPIATLTSSQTVGAPQQHAVAKLQDRPFASLQQHCHST